MVLSSDEIVAIGMDPGQTASFVEQSYLVSHYLLKMLKIQQQTEIPSVASNLGMHCFSMAHQARL